MEGKLKQVLQECNQVCKDLSDILEKENEALSVKRNVKAVEGNYKAKKQLTLQLEKFVGVIKVNFEAIRTSVEMVKDLTIFKRLIEGYQALVARNAMLLKAAQTATSMILESIGKQTKRPAVKTYNSYGYGQTVEDRGPSLINYSV